MNVPSAEQYVDIIAKKTPGTLATLHNYEFHSGKEEGFFYKKGRHTIVFKAENEGKWYAIRFFLHDEPELFRRYHQLQTFLNPKPFSWKLPFEFLDGEYYPVMKMDWIDSLSFSGYLDLIINDRLLITQLQQRLVSLSREFEAHGMAHGNLNLDHIRFVKTGPGYELKLIDYDAMFIPAFEGRDSLSAGTASFQHPMRLASDFSEKTDRFSIWVFLTALEAFKIDPSLWTEAARNGFDKSKQLLFNFRDLAQPQQSRAFQIIKNYRREALDFYAGRLARFCEEKDLGAIEAPRMHGEPATPMTRPPVPEKRPALEATVVREEKPAPPPPPPVRRTSVNVRIEKNIPPPEIKLPPKQAPATAARVETTTPVSTVPWDPDRKKKLRRVLGIAAIAGALIFTSIYFVRGTHSAEPALHSPSTAQKAAAEPVSPPVRQTAVQEARVTPDTLSRQTVFTSGNITQFLFQLYQSYNKRDLSAILSNYADQLNQYYDAGAVTKKNLGGIIKNLFIKPAYYECRPDLRTLQIKEQPDSCSVTITINESIKATQRSKTENYPSTIQYTIDSSFKIHSEKSME